jgi:site-specific DNA recombinase
VGREGGHEHVSTFSVRGGRSYELDRPSLNQLIQAAKRREFDLVAVWRYDRFSRDEEQAIIAVHLLKQHGIRLVSVTQSLPDGLPGTVMLARHNFVSAPELQGIRARIAEGKLKRVRSGKLLIASTAKYGYQFVGEKKERYEPHPLTAPVVQRIFDEVVGGKIIRGIAEMLTEEGVPTPSEAMARDGIRYKGGKVAFRWRASTT